MTPTFGSEFLQAVEMTVVGGDFIRKAVSRGIVGRGVVDVEFLLDTAVWS